ncbi:MAG: restriction endonuclease [Flavobacteriales bacterium]|nr:restriction endonuclease [Flavobacteriales bacterium]
MNQIDVYEHGRLLIDEKVFTRKHWNAFVKLNTVHDGAYFEVLHNGLKFKQFVGVIQVDGLLVHIHPKADKDENEGRWKGVLLQMLKACGKVKAQTAGNAQLKKQRINLLEVYFEYFLNEMEGLIHAGLVKKYRKETRNVKALKGKLEFAGNIRRNLVHKERFYTTHQVYDSNHELHQVLRHALDIVGQFTRGTRLNDNCRRVQMAFPEVDSINPTGHMLSSIKLNRKTAPYERALELAKFIILNYSPDINRGPQKMIALLFNMNELWEEYVLKMLKNYSLDHPEMGLKVSGQESKLFYGSSRTIRPDIVLRKGEGGDEEVFVIDTKWKRPINRNASIEDLRQMYTYGRFWNARKLMLIYPGDHASSDFNFYHNLELDGRRHECKSAFVSIFDTAGMLDSNLGSHILEHLNT